MLVLDSNGGIISWVFQGFKFVRILEHKDGGYTNKHQ